VELRVDGLADRHAALGDPLRKLPPHGDADVGRLHDREHVADAECHVDRHFTNRLDLNDLPAQQDEGRRPSQRDLADAIGVISPPNALFLIALGVVFVLLLHFSIATSRLSEETKILAQEVARLDAEARAAREALPNGDGASRTSPAPQEAPADREAPSRASASDQ